MENAHHSFTSKCMQVGTENILGFQLLHPSELQEPIWKKMYFHYLL
jgi:hypothetical protein